MNEEMDMSREHGVYGVDMAAPGQESRWSIADFPSGTPALLDHLPYADCIALTEYLGTKEHFTPDPEHSNGWVPMEHLSKDAYGNCDVFLHAPKSRVFRRKLKDRFRIGVGGVVTTMLPGRFLYHPSGWDLSLLYRLAVKDPSALLDSPGSHWEDFGTLDRFGALLELDTPEELAGEFADYLLRENARRVMNAMMGKTRRDDFR